MPGTERSGRKGIGESLFAERLYGHLKGMADWLRETFPDGVPAYAEQWIETSHALVMQQEIAASKVTLAAKLLEGDDVTDACLRLAWQHAERYGPILRLAGAA